MSKLTEQEINDLKLENKIELSWSEANKFYVQEDGFVPKVTPIDWPTLAITHYDVRYKPAGGDMIEEIDSRYISAGIFGRIPDGATHYCLGPATYSIEEQWHHKTIQRPIMFFKRE